MSRKKRICKIDLRALENLDRGADGITRAVAISLYVDLARRLVEQDRDELHTWHGCGSIRPGSKAAISNPGQCCLPSVYASTG